MDPRPELLPLFLHLCRIEGAPRSERPVVDEVMKILRTAHIEVVEDGAGAVIGGDAGNLLCFPPLFDRNIPATMMVAHLDTIRPTGTSAPVVKEDRIVSDGKSILGSDNRAAVAVLVRLLIDAARSDRFHKNFFVLFTVAEEIGLFGSGAADLSRYQVEEAFVFDCSQRPGTYIRECAGLHLFRAQIHGIAAHAGIAPEEGVNAITLASKAISQIQLGHIDADTTANIVPDLVTIQGEVRSFNTARIRRELDRIERVLRDHVEPAGRVTFRTDADFDPYVLDTESRAVRLLETALRLAGLTPRPIRYTGGSDANKLNSRGIPSVNIGIGAQKPHSHEEFILLEDLAATMRIAEALIEVRPGEIIQ
jgi:tripeptide aminopeptidase